MSSDIFSLFLGRTFSFVDHPPLRNFDKQEYLSCDPFIFNTEKGMTALPVTLPPWSRAPKTLSTFLHSKKKYAGPLATNICSDYVK